MILKIRQVKNIIVNEGDIQYIFVKRKMGFRLISSFYKNDKLIFESSMITYILKSFVKIKFQHLPDIVSMERKSGWWYSLYYNENVLSIKVKYFRRPAFRLFLNGEEIGSIGNPELISIGCRYYEMNTDTKDETIKLYFLILFLSQLKGF